MTAKQREKVHEFDPFLGIRRPLWQMRERWVEVARIVVTGLIALLSDRVSLFGGVA